MYRDQYGEYAYRYLGVEGKEIKIKSMETKVHSKVGE